MRVNKITLWRFCVGSQSTVNKNLPIILRETFTPRSSRNLIESYLQKHLMYFIIRYRDHSECVKKTYITILT